MSYNLISLLYTDFNFIWHRLLGNLDSSYWNRTITDIVTDIIFTVSDIVAIPTSPQKFIIVHPHFLVGT